MHQPTAVTAMVRTGSAWNPADWWKAPNIAVKHWWRDDDSIGYVIHVHPGDLDPRHVVVNAQVFWQRGKDADRQCDLILTAFLPRSDNLPRQQAITDHSRDAQSIGHRLNHFLVMTFKQFETYRLTGDSDWFKSRMEQRLILAGTAGGDP